MINSIKSTTLACESCKCNKDTMILRDEEQETIVLCGTCALRVLGNILKEEDWKGRICSECGGTEKVLKSESHGYEICTGCALKNDRKKINFDKDFSVPTEVCKVCEGEKHLQKIWHNQLQKVIFICDKCLEKDWPKVTEWPYEGE